MGDRRVVAGPVDEIPPGSRKIVVPFRGRAGIGVFNVNGTYHALRNLCPHKSGPLCTGHVSGRIVSERPPSGGDVPLGIERDGEIIRCPWHLWEFDIATGLCLVDARARVKTYPVAVEDGRVIVYADEADLPAQPTTPVSPLQLEPTRLAIPVTPKRANAGRRPAGTSCAADGPGMGCSSAQSRIARFF